MAYGMLIDQEKCVGCHACATSCKAANGTPPGVTRAKVVRTTKGSYPNVEREIIPMLCMHCENAACVEVCPTGATTKREEDGIVVIDKEVCIGCKTCMTACPYNARYFCEETNGYFGDGLTEYEEVKYKNMPSDVVDKCDFCLSRTDEGKTPSPVCVAACMAGARVFGELDAIKAQASSEGGVQLVPEEGTEPAVYYVPNLIV